MTKLYKQKLDAFSGFLYSYHLTKGEGLLLETKVGGADDDKSEFVWTYR